MKNFLLIIFSFLSFSVLGQYTYKEGSFSKTFTQVRNYQMISSDLAENAEWTYTGGNVLEWTFHFNVDFFPCPSCPEMRGTVMENNRGEPRFFMNYLGNIIESSDDYGEYGAFKVDILSKDDETGKWKWWESGECRYYGNWVMLYLRNPPDLRFDYFMVKE
jgi:hypothetical protein